jgi:hypothetical protein
MARLQPMPASHELLASFDAAIYALRPNWAQPDPDMRAEVQRLGWRILADNGSSSQAGIWQKLEAVMQGHGGVVDPACSELSRGIFDELPPWKVQIQDTTSATALPIACHNELVGNIVYTESELTKHSLKKRQARQLKHGHAPQNSALHASCVFS